MTRKERREANLRWRCEYCGRFIGQKDLENGTAKTGCAQVYNPWAEDVDEELWGYHVACEEGAKCSAV